MVRQYLRPKSQDASPFLGISECEPAVSDYEASKSNSPYIPKHTIQQQSGDTAENLDSSYYSKVPVPPLPTHAHQLVQQHQKHLGTGVRYGSVAGKTMRLNIRIMPGVPDTNERNTNQSSIKVTGKSRQRPETMRSHASSGAYSATSVFSPLVVDRPTTGLQRTSNNSAAANVEYKSLVVSLNVLDTTTIEELASAIEAAHSQHAVKENASDDLAPLACAALFRGQNVPLLFGQRVRDMLESGDTVFVYSNISCDDVEGIGAYQPSDSDDDYPVIIDYARNAGSECVFVPLSEESAGAGVASTSLGAANTATTLQSSTASAAALETRVSMKRNSYAGSVLSVGNVDMSGIGRLISQAPLKARFINVLVHPPLLRAFMGFCALPSEMALESLLFVLDVERFRHVQPSMARLLANYIYLSYIAPSAPLRINVSRTMRERVPWPFLPGWEYNPWVFDEILASVGFTLKKHTLLRFERSPVGLASLIQNSSINSAHYVRPLVFDMEIDPMTAIAEQFEPDINVVIWVNELQQSGDSGTLLLSNLGQLTVGFREQLLERIAAQFVDEHNAHCLCDGYFRLELQLAPLQKQRKIHKTRKLRNFFGDNPHEALLRQQLMAVVPPSSHLTAARAAAELVARKRNAEARLRACDNVNRQESVSSSLIAEQKMLDSDCESDGDQRRRLQQQHLQGWVHDAMLRSSSSSPLLHPRVNSWSDSESSCNERSAHSKAVNQNGWTTDEDDVCGASAERRNAIHAAPADVQSSAYNDQTFNRALSMIGMSHADSQDSNSSDGGSPQMRPTRGRTGNGGRGLAAAAAADGSDGLPAVQCYSVYTAHVHSSASLGRAAGGLHGHGLGRGHRFTRFERKKRADKLRDFFGRMDHGSEDHQSSFMIGASGACVDSADARSASVVSSIPSASVRSVSFAPSDTPLTSEQRNILVRRRRKLKALLGEQVEESIISVSAPPVKSPRERTRDSTSEDIGSFSLSALDESAYSLLTPEYTSQTSSGTMSSTNPDDMATGINFVDGELKARELREAQVKQYSKIRDVLGDAAPATSLYRNHSQQPSTSDDNADISHEQRLRARWRRNKLANMLGDLPSNITTLYVTDNKLPSSSSDAPSDIEEHAIIDESAAHRSKDGHHQQQQQQRAKKLRHFFGQSLNSDAMLMQGISKMPVCYPENASSPAVFSDTDQSFEFVEQPNASRLRSSRQWQLPSVSQSPVTDVVPGVLEHQHIPPNNNACNSEDGLLTPAGAQFWMTSSPESQESVVTADGKSGNRNSLLASLRARKASIIGSIKRSSPSSTSSAPKQVLAATEASPQLPTRPRTSTLSSHTSRTASSVRDLNGKRHSSHSLTNSHITASPGKRSFLSRKNNRANGSPALSTKSPASLTKTKLWGSNGEEPRVSQKSSPLNPPARLSSIKPLSPLPAISPNNLQASFDRGVALREVVAVADYISGGVAQSRQRKSQFSAGVNHKNQTDFPPRISSAEDRYDHRQVISSVLMSSSMRGTRSRSSTHPHKQQQQQQQKLPPLLAIEPRDLLHLNESKISAHGKSVHWFDSPQEDPRKSAERDRWHNPKPIRQTRVSLDEFPSPASGKSSMELSMSIVLRSPLPKNPSIKSPTLSPRIPVCSPPCPRISQLPIASPPPAPRMSLSHKASISAVGGRQITTGSGVVGARRPTLDINSRFSATTNSSSKQNTEPAYSSTVTIRTRRSQSLAMHRRLERTTLGRKRANTIGTGRQAESRQPTQTKDADNADLIPHVDKNSRRVQSMIIPAQHPSEIKTGRERCATVIPLHLELQCLLARRLAIAAQTCGSLTTISESEELFVAKPGITDSELQTLRRTADALYTHRLQPKATSAFPITSGKNTPLLSSGSTCTAFNPQQQPRRRSCQLEKKLQNLSANAALGIPVPYGRHRSRSCAGRFMTSRKRTPIQPAVTRYLQSVNAGHLRYGHTSMARRNSYQRISMALLSRPLAHLNGAYGRSNGRRSLDTRSTHRKLSPYMESSLRHFSSMGNDNLRRPAANINNENHI